MIAPKDIGMDLDPNFEFAIYQIADDWKRIVLAIDEALPGPAINPDLCLAKSYSFRREDWSPLCKRIGHGADPANIESLRAAREIVFESGEGDYLPLLAVNALIHAVEHNLDTLELVDGDEGQTNLWEVVNETAGPYDPNGPWEDRAALARMFSFQWELRAQAIEHLEQLVAERPTAFNTVQALVAQYLWEDKWDKISDLANRLLESEQTSTAKGVLLRLRGESCWNEGKMDEAREHAEAAAELGSQELLSCLNSQK